MKKITNFIIDGLLESKYIILIIGLNGLHYDDIFPRIFFVLTTGIAIMFIVIGTKYNR